MLLAHRLVHGLSFIALDNVIGWRTSWLRRVVSVPKMSPRFGRSHLLVLRTWWPAKKGLRPFVFKQLQQIPYLSPYSKSRA
jgi:hypothetical protein